MAKFHISPKTGNPNKCYAHKRACPVGDSNEHYASADEAREAFEAKRSTFEKSATKKPNSEMPRGKPMNSHNAAIGDEYMDEDGFKYRVTGKNPAGAFGIAESAGPGVKLTRLKEDGSLSGYTRTVQHGGYYTPDQYTSVVRPLNGFQEGKTSYDSAVIAFVQKEEFTKDPQAFLKTRRNNMVRVIVPNVGRLTDKKRLNIGREAWAMSGRDTATWDNASEDERLRWTRTHMGRYSNVEVEVGDGKVSWTTDSTSGNGHSLEDVRLIES